MCKSGLRILPPRLFSKSRRSHEGAAWECLFEAGAMFVHVITVTANHGALTVYALIKEKCAEEVTAVLWLKIAVSILFITI